MRNPILTKIGGNYHQNPKKAKLGTAAKEMIVKVMEGIPKGEFMDYHMHILGIGIDNPHIWVNPGILSLRHPMDYFKIKVFMNASGITSRKKADGQYKNRLLTLIDDIPTKSKFCLFAMDGCYSKEGKFIKEDSKFTISNEYVYNFYKEKPDQLIPVISVHPFKPGALEELEKWQKKGVKMIKWLPAIMGMDPSDPEIVPFYQKVKELDMILLSHSGQEDTVPVVKFQPLNNPLLFRLPLEIGVKVVLAHCGGKGTAKDLDNNNKMVDQHELFFRLMDEPKYEGLLFGDISAMVQSNRCGKPLADILNKREHHHRLLYGSDYPLPAINAGISLKLLHKLKYLDKVDIDPLCDIYKKNPLLFSFALKRRLRDPNDPSYRLPATMFYYKPELGINL